MEKKKTRNNCFESKKCSTTLRQSITGKAFVLTSYRLKKGRATFIRFNKTAANFLAPYGVIFQSDVLPYIKTPIFGGAFSYEHTR